VIVKEKSKGVLLACRSDNIKESLYVPNWGQSVGLK